MLWDPSGSSEHLHRGGKFGDGGREGGPHQSTGRLVPASGGRAWGGGIPSKRNLGGIESIDQKRPRGKRGTRSPGKNPGEKKNIRKGGSLYLSIPFGGCVSKKDPLNYYGESFLFERKEEKTDSLQGRPLFKRGLRRGVVGEKDRSRTIRGGGLEVGF